MFPLSPQCFPKRGPIVGHSIQKLVSGLVSTASDRSQHSNRAVAKAPQMVADVPSIKMQAQKTGCSLITMDSTLTMQVDELFLLVVRHVPQLLLVALVTFILTLFAKDILNGLKRPFLNPDQWLPLPLVDKKVLTHNTRRFRFALPHSDQKLGLPIGQHVSLKVVDGSGAEVLRSYTPSSDIDQRGFVDFVIKIYPQGQMTQQLDKLNIGDNVLFKGPKGRFKYQTNSKRAIGMLAGGTGIAPMYQVLQAILKNPNDKTQLSLIFGNLTADDVLLKEELDGMAAKFPQRVKVHYVLNTAPKGWTGGVGFITEEMIKTYLPAPAADVLILRCGPAPMNKAMEVHLDVLGYPKDCQFQF